MPATRIEPLASVRTRLEYVEFGKGGRGDYRPVAAYCSMQRSQFIEHAHEVRRETGRKVEAYGLRISWAHDELDPGDPESIARALDMTREAVHALYPHCEFHAAVHMDGEGGCVHTHTEIINNDETTGRAITRNRTHRAASKVADEVSAANGIEPKAAQRGCTWEQRRRTLSMNEEKNRFDLWLGDTLQECRKSSSSRREFLQKVADSGVEVRIKRDDQGREIGITYAAEDQFSSRKAKRRRAGSRIASDFTLTEIDSLAGSAAGPVPIVIEEGERPQVTVPAVSAALGVAQASQDGPGADSRGAVEVAGIMNRQIAAAEGDITDRLDAVRDDAGTLGTVAFAAQIVRIFLEEGAQIDRVTERVGREIAARAAARLAGMESRRKTADNRRSNRKFAQHPAQHRTMPARPRTAQRVPARQPGRSL